MASRQVALVAVVACCIYAHETDQGYDPPAVPGTTGALPTKGESKVIQDEIDKLGKPFNKQTAQERDELKDATKKALDDYHDDLEIRAKPSPPVPNKPAGPPSSNKPPGSRPGTNHKNNPKKVPRQNERKPPAGPTVKSKDSKHKINRESIQPPSPRHAQRAGAPNGPPYGRKHNEL